MGFVEGHGLLDASINYSMDHWTFMVFGRNLTDEDEPSAALVVAGLFSFQATRDPRIWGAQVTYDW
jgi:outer membrane receptor protein involved in Fe transport